MTDVCVVGLGKIGLPLACAIARAGHRVHGADISDGVVEMVNSAREPFPGEGGLADALAETVGSGRLTATTDTTAAVRQSEVIIIVVPLVVDENAEPDFGAMDAATSAVARGLRAGTLVSYETTLPVGTTRNRFVPAIAAESELRPGEGLFVVHSPERVFSGRIFEDLRRYPKLVGGIDNESARRGVEFYSSFIDFDDRPDLARPNGVWDLGSAEAAELAKLAETTYRDLNIAYANELAIAAEAVGVDIYRIIEACNSQPFSHIHRPGISVGGHCIPVYPYFLLESVPGMELVRIGRQVNADMPRRAVDAVRTILADLHGRRIGILGLSYRPGVKEHAFSGAFDLVNRFLREGAEVLVWDPMYLGDELRELGLDALAVPQELDAAVIHTAHPQVFDLSPVDFPGIKCVYDGRASLDTNSWPGVTVLTVGLGGQGSV